MRALVDRGYRWMQENPVTVAFVVLGVAIVAVFFRGEEIRRIVTRAPTVTNTCPSFKKVGYPCPKPGSKAARLTKGHAVPDSGIRNEGVVDSNGHAPSSQPSPPSHGGHQGGSKGGGKTPKSPPNVVPPAQPVDSSPENLTPTGEPGNNGKGNGPFGKAVGQVGEDVHGVVEDVHGKACSLLEAC